MFAKHAGAPRPMSPLRAAALFVAVTVAAPSAQQIQDAVASNAENAPVAPPTATVETTVASNEVQLLVGRSTLVNVGHPITRVSLTSPTVADAMVTATNQLLVHGKAPGTITMFVWDRLGGIKRYEVSVQRDLSILQHQVKTLFPGEPISVYGNGKDVVIAGTVSSKYVIEKAAEVAAGYVEKKEDVVNLLKQQDGVATQQVLLRVRFAEVSRNAMTELGATTILNGFKDGRWFGRTSTQQFAAPDFSSERAGGLVFSDFLNLFVYDAKNNLGGVIKALQGKGLFQSLAEPNLIAENGKEASFLAGGEYPYPVVQGGGDRTAVTIVFKEFGIKLNFTPTIVGADLVKLKVRPEVSTLDFSNAVVLEGFRIPALSTRRTETEVELQDGQTFAIAGLMNNTVTSQLSKIPGIGDIPILGLLFRSKAAKKEQTELVVMITPTILRRNSTGVSPSLPNIQEQFMGPIRKPLPAPAPWNPGAQPQAMAPPAPSPLAAQPVQAPPAPVRSVAAPPAPQAPSAAEPVPAPAVSEGIDLLPPAQTKPAAQPVRMTKAEKEALERQQKAEKKRLDAEAKHAAAQRRIAEEQAREQAKRDAKRQAEEQKLAAKQAEAARKTAEQVRKDQAKLEAELARRRAEADKKQAAEDVKRAEALAKAQQKLQQAQAEYEAASRPQQ